MFNDNETAYSKWPDKAGGNLLCKLTCSNWAFFIKWIQMHVIANAWVELALVTSGNGRGSFSG